MSCVSSRAIAVVAAASFGILSSERQVHHQIHHAGHSAHHVTRLHRYEHAGPGSMLEEEVKWTKYVAEAKMRESQKPSGRVLKQVRHIRGAPDMFANGLEETAGAGTSTDEEPKFLKMSERQVSALEEHHRTWSSLFQTAMEDAKSLKEIASAKQDITTKKSEFTQPNGALLQRFKAQIKQLGEKKGTEQIIATALSSLSSQYVGPIGIGTSVEPAGCVFRQADSSAPLTLVNAASNETDTSNKSSNFWSDLFSSFSLMNQSSGIANETNMTCRIKDQTKLWMVHDTGSTNIWANADVCREGPCRLPGRHLYNHSASATFAYPNSMLQLTVQFGTGQIKGPQAVDDFHIGPFSVYNQTFAMIEQESGSVFRDVPFEGILGLAFPKMSANGATPFFDNVIQQKALKHNEFAFYFSRDKPSANAIFWGGVDKTFYKGDLEYFPVTDPYYWSLKMNSFKIGGEEIYGMEDKFEGVKNTARSWMGPVAIVDSGTTWFTAERDKFQTVLDKLPSATCSSMTDETHPPITITLQNSLGKPKDFVLTNKQYMTSIGKGATARCSPAFMHIDLPREHGPGIVLGEVFMRNFFAVFDRGSGVPEEGRIALAASEDTDAAHIQLHALTAGQESFGGQEQQSSDIM
mmetsp:Transcript_50910/g.79605  ORF Transcript_50910/g.79605 Transcript_50910/m.79605 type:complete len:635 (-) Transcript_50910:55-1959(-)